MESLNQAAVWISDPMQYETGTSSSERPSQGEILSDALSVARVLNV